MKQPIPQWLVNKIKKEINTLEESQKMWYLEETKGRIQALQWVLAQQK